MSYNAKISFPGLVAMLALAVTFAVTAAESDFTLAYCSSDNTGDSNGANFWTWQSNGWCHDKCDASYAFAIVLGNNCWCSNYIPVDQQTTSDCSDSCPGFPSEQCGNAAKNLYGYIALNRSPAGTQGASQPTSATPSSAPPSPVSSASHSATPSLETVFQTVTVSASVATSIPSSTPASTTLHTTVSSAAQTAASSSPAPELTSIVIQTESGAVVTKTIVTSPESTGPALTQNRKKSSSVGPIVGGVIGGLVALAAIAALIFFVLKKRRQHDGDAGQDTDSKTDKNGVHRNVSTMSKAGLLRGEKQPQYPPPIATTFSSKRNSRHLDNESISPISVTDRRSSRPYVFDQRLNPSAIMVLDNTSRGSFVSLDDSRDYGRELNVRNPDPEPRESVDSRPRNLRP